MGRLKLQPGSRLDSCTPAAFDLSVDSNLMSRAARCHSLLPLQLYLLSRKSLSSIPGFLI